MRTLVFCTLAAAALACDPAPAASPDGEGGGTATGGGGTSTPLTSSHLEVENLTRIISALASDELDGRNEGTPGGDAARALVIDEMKRCGIVPAVGDSFEQPITTGIGANVLGLVVGTDPALSDRTIIVSAHHDHLGHCDGAICNGADDNAAGVAIILGIGCALAENPPAKTVMIASWDAEEPPTFLTEKMGSRFYAEHPVIGLDRTDAVIVLDLVGSDLWPGFGGHFLLGSELSPEVTAAVQVAVRPPELMAYRTGLHLAEEQPIGHQPWSDYDAFRNLGKPVLFLSNGQNKRYHTPADELATLNLPKISLEGTYLLRIVHALANAPATPTFVADGADYASDAVSVIAVLEAALASGGLVDALGLTQATRDKLSGDLAAAQQIAAEIDSGATPTAAQVRRLRDGTQRVMCLAGSSYDENTCNLF